MISLRDRLPNSLHNALEFLHGSHNATLDQFKFGADSCTQLIQSSVICFDVLDRMCRLRELPEEVILGSDWMKQDGEMLREAASGSEERWQERHGKGCYSRQRR